jgi:hypothetical protein
MQETGLTFSSDLQFQIYISRDTRSQANNRRDFTFMEILEGMKTLFELT